MTRIYLILALIIIFGCNNPKTDCKYIVLDSPSIDYYDYPNSLPKDFRIKIDIAFDDVYTYDSKDSILVKNFDWEKYCKIKLGLTIPEKDTIYKDLKMINILSFPHYYNTGKPCMPCPQYDFTFSFDGISKEIVWNESDIRGRERPNKLKKLFILCDSIIRHKDVYILKTPDDTRVYE